jgi:hypothetical protein
LVVDGHSDGVFYVSCPGYLAGEALAAEMGVLTRTFTAAGYAARPDEEEPDRVIEARLAVA